MGNAALKKHYATAEKTGVLNISKSKLHDFPPELLNLQSVLRTLDISYNKFSVLPNVIGLFKSLKSLSIDHNFLSQLPDEISTLVKLETLSVQSNKLISLPQSMSILSSLKQVNLSENELTVFPLVFCGLKHLDVLDVSRNKIHEIPSRINGLHVTELNINQNQISVLSEDIAKCPRLKTLRMQENCLQLSSIPIRLLTDSKVSILSLEGNLFEMKNFMDLEGYEQYMERYTAVKKKLF